MKPMMVISRAFLLCGLASFTAAAPNEAEDVKAAFLNYIAAINTEDVDAAAQHYSSDYSGFLGTGGLLVEGIDKDFLKAAFEAGVKVSFQVRHLKVAVFDNAAVVTAYLAGMTTLWDGISRQGTWRASHVWIKQGGQWKAAHWHASPLILAPSQ